MSITKCLVQNHVLISVLLVTALRPAAMEAASESDRLERLERAVEQLQKRNAELEAEVRSLKQPTASVPDGKFKTKIIQDGKNVRGEICAPSRETADIRAAARSGIEVGAGRIRSGEF